MNRQKLATIVGASSMICILGLAGTLFLKTSSPLVQDPVAARVQEDRDQAELTDVRISQWVDDYQPEKAPEEYVELQEAHSASSDEDLGNFKIDLSKASKEAEKLQKLEESRQEEEPVEKASSSSSQDKQLKKENAKILGQKDAEKDLEEKADESSAEISLNEELSSEESSDALESSNEQLEEEKSEDAEEDAQAVEEPLKIQLSSADEELAEEELSAEKEAEMKAKAEQEAIEKATAEYHLELEKEEKEAQQKALEEAKLKEAQNEAEKAEEEQEEENPQENIEELDESTDLLSEIKENEEQRNETAPQVLAPQRIYSFSEFQHKGVIHWQGYQFTFYSQSVLPGNKLSIPGRHVNADGFVCDDQGYIVIAYGGRRGDVIPTPFGYWGKIYDYCETPGTYDCYVK